MAKLLIIGGTGFFGKSILDSFQRGMLDKWSINKIVIMARNPQKLLDEAPELVSSSIEFCEADICNVDVLPDCEYVIHAAASTDASKYLRQGEEERKNIIMGTINYCSLAPKFHRKSKIVFCSSGAVYGSQASNVQCLEETAEYGNAEELTEAKRAYAYAKRDSERAIHNLGKDKGMSVSIARCFAFVGMYLPRDQHFAIGNFIADALANRPITVKASNEVFRSYMYADDLVEWLMTICESSNSNAPIYNVGSGQKIEVHELGKLIASMYGCAYMGESELSGGVDIYVPCISKAKESLGLEIKHNLVSAIERIVSICA